MPRAFCRSSAQGEIIRPNDSSVRPAPSTRRGPATAASGCARRRATSRSIAPAGTTQSLLSSSSSVPDDARMPILLATANPALLPCATTLTIGQRRRTASTLPSLDALSTTMISCGMAGGFVVSDSRQRSRSARVLKLTITIDSLNGVIVTAVAPCVRCSPGSASPPRPMSSAAAPRPRDEGSRWFLRRRRAPRGGARP